MSTGVFRTLDQFAWNVSLTDAAQRAAVQSAFDSGEPLLWPCGDDVRTDEPLIMANPTHLVGHGCNTTFLAASGSSQLRTSAQIDVLLVRAKVTIRGLHVHADNTGAGRGVVIGDNATAPSGCYFENVSTGQNFDCGFDQVGGQESTFLNCFPNSQTAAFRSNNANSDLGDSRIIGGASNAMGTSGACFSLLRGGGWYISGGHKFGHAVNHINVQWNGGSSASLIVDGCGFEGASGFQSCLLSGTQPFKRVVFKGNSWGNNVTAIGITGPSGIWLSHLVVMGNVIEIDAATFSGLYVDCVSKFGISDNVIDMFGFGDTGIFTGSSVSDGWIGPNIIRGTNGSYPVIDTAASGSNVKVYSPQP